MLELRHLRHFIAVAEELHFARAAERLGMEQSPLSQSIRNLEDELGVKLFERTTRRTWLTQAGDRFYEEARKILRGVEIATSAAREGDSGVARNIRIVLGDDLASKPFTRLLYGLQYGLSKDQVEVLELTHADAPRSVRNREADVAITLNSRSEPDLTQKLAWKEPLVAVLPLDHQLAERKSIALRDIMEYPIALPTEAECPGYVAQIESLLRRHHVTTAQRRDIRHWNTALSFAATGHAIALLPKTMIRGSPDVAAVAIDEEDALLATWILYREGDASSAVSSVLRVAAEVARDIRESLPPGFAD